MAQLLKTEITGSLTNTGSLIVSGSQPVQLPLLTSGSGDVDPELITNQFWFDVGDNNIKYSTIGSYGTGAWSTGGALIISRAFLSAAGYQNAALGFGGLTPSYVTCTEEYDGSTWTAGGALIIARRSSAGAGIQNAALMAGGFTGGQSSATEEYNGSSWSSGGNLIQSRNGLAGSGTQNATLVNGGSTPTVVSCTEEYNGSSWSSGGARIVAIQQSNQGGSQNAAVSSGGLNPSATRVSCTEKYDGTSWSAGGALITNRGGLAGTLNGTQNSFVSFGGNNPSAIACTEEFDGTTYTTQANLSIARYALGGAGNHSSGLAFGGAPAYTNVTEEWTRPFIQPFTCTLPITYTYSTFAGLSTNRYFLGSSATAGTSALAFGGSLNPATTAATEEWGGSAWSTGGNLIIARRHNAGSACGSVNSALSFGGTANPVSQVATEQYDGTSWTSKNNMITARQLLAGSGDVDSALAIGGFSTTPTIATYANTEEFNGTTWSEGGALITGRQKINATGAQNATLAFGGNNPGYLNLTEEYDGSSWATGGAMSQAAAGRGGAGIQNAALAFGGYPTSKTAVEQYDGSAWSTLPDSPNDVRTGAGGGKVDGAFIFGTYNDQTGTCLVVATGATICTNTYKCNLPSAWSVGGATIVTGYSARAGIQNSYSSVAGYSDSNAHENYNGTSWSSATDAPTSNVSRAGAGADADNTVIFGGNSIATTIEWNGSSWATCGDMNVARYYHTGTGTQNDAGTAGGYNGAYRACHESYNGATWTNETQTPTTLGLAGSAGSGADDNLVAGADGSSCSNKAYQWNGSAWTTLTTMNVAKHTSQGNGASSNDAMIFGGSLESGPYSAEKCTEKWNGTSWSNDCSMVIGGSMGYSGGSGATTSAGIAGPRYVYPSYVACVEEYNSGPSVYFNRDTCVRCVTGTCTQIS